MTDKRLAVILRYMTQRAVPFNASLGARVAEIRKAQEATQDQLAAAARTAGLRWSRSVVAALETGGREVDLAEAVRLVVALRYLTDQPYELADLVPAGGRVELEPGIVWSSESVRDVLAGRAASVEIDMNDLLRRRQYRMALADSAGEAEHKAARSLGVPVDDVVRAARRLWRRSLTEQRDAEVADLVDDETLARTLQAVRGHVTRSLVDELRHALKGGD